MRQLRKVVPASLAAAALALASMTTGSAQAALSADQPGPRLFTPAHQVVMTIHNSGPNQWVEFNPALYLSSRGQRFEIDVRRTDSRQPITATVRFGNRDRVIPSHYLAGWSGFKRAFVLTWRTRAGTTISRSTVAWCPNDGTASRLGPKAATSTAFTYGCSTHPFTRSQRWGIDRGWARQLLTYSINPPTLPSGNHFILDVALRKALAQLFGVPESQRTIRFRVTIKHVTDPSGPPPFAVRNAAPGDPTTLRSSAVSSRQLAPSRPGTNNPAPIPADVLPDLIALPAFGISTHHESGRDWLDFGATVFNDGPGPLVAEGYRRGGQPVMDAYQMFYRGTHLVAANQVGTMAYDARPTHQHWHFKDFARYDLVNGHGLRLRTSGKEAFCLAPTDPIDLLLPGAVVDPGNSNLSTACGDIASIWVREVLASGWGDTYTQSRAGQSINITGLPNGTYWIRITANPAHRLLESSAKNDASLRRIRLGGTPGHRTVRVPAYGLINSEASLQQPAPPPLG